MTVDEKLNKLLARRGWKQGELARRMDTSTSTVSNWCGAKSRPDPRGYLKLARALDVSVEYLIDDDQDEPVPALTPEQEEILRWAAGLGYSVALNRLKSLPDDAPPAATVPTIGVRRVAAPPMFPDEGPGPPGPGVPSGPTSHRDHDPEFG